MLAPLLTIWLYAAPCICPVYCHHGSSAWCRVNYWYPNEPKRWWWTLPPRHHFRRKP